MSTRQISGDGQPFAPGFWKGNQSTRNYFWSIWGNQSAFNANGPLIIPARGSVHNGGSMGGRRPGSGPYVQFWVVGPTTRIS